MTIRQLKLSEICLVPVSCFLAGSALLATAVGLYAVSIGGLDNRKLSLVLLILPFFLGTIVLREAPDLLFAFLLVSLSLSARFRPPGRPFHPGGAELAIAPIDFPLFVLTLFWLIRLSRRSRIPNPLAHPLFWPFVLLLVSHLLSIIPAANPSLALLEVLRLLKMALLVVIVSNYLSSCQKLKFAVQVLFGMVILQGALAVIQSTFGISLGLGFLGEHQYWRISQGNITIGRAGGTLGHANVLANYNEVLTPIAFALVLSRVRGRLRLLGYAALLSGIIGTFLTFSRAGWVSLAVGLFLVAFQYRKRLPITRVVPLLLIVGSVVGLIGLVLKDLIAARFIVFWEGSRLVRVMTAETALNMLRSHTILGVGANNYLEVSSNYVDSSLAPGLARIAGAVVHNIFLLYAAELGVVGFVTFVVLLLSFMRLAWSISRYGDPLLESLSVGVLAGVIALVAHGMWDWLLRYDPVYTLFWFSGGFIVAIANVVASQRTARLQCTIGKRPALSDANVGSGYILTDTHWEL